MSAGGGGEGGLDFDLNLAPIIDCFTVLITFMLISASFLSLTVIQASVAPLEEAAPDDSIAAVENGVSVSVQLMKSGDIEMNLSGSETRSIHLAAAAKGSRDIASLSERLREVKSKYPKTASFTLSAEPKVKYSELVEAMEAARAVVPGVMLGGF